VAVAEDARAIVCDGKMTGFAVTEVVLSPFFVTEVTNPHNASKKTTITSTNQSGGCLGCGSARPQCLQIFAWFWIFSAQYGHFFICPPSDIRPKFILFDSKLSMIKTWN
jgi:hypothetical protein